MKLITLLMALLIATPAMAQRSKNKTETAPPSVIATGVPYTLPRTAIRVKLEATQTTFIPGPYAPWAEPLLGIKGAKTQAQSFWNIEKISFDTFGDPDPGQTYKTNSLDGALLQLTPEGCLVGINSNFTPGKRELPVSNSYTSGHQSKILSFDYLIDNPNLSGRAAPEQRAAEAAFRILKVRATRYDIAAGLLDEFHPDGDAYEESFRELQNIEEKNLALFTGKSVTENFTFYYDFIPSSEPAKGEVIFRFDENLGFLSKNDFSGKPVTIDVEKTEKPGTEEVSNPVTQTNGIFYRRPGMALVRLTKELAEIASTRLPVAQFGKIEFLPAELIQQGHSVEFHPETGGIKSISKKQ